MRIFKRLLRYALVLALAGILMGGLAVGAAYWLIAPRLPSVASLKDVRLQVPLRVYTADGKLIATFGETRRIPVRIQDVPDRLKKAFLAAEDANFYDHPGIDWQGFARAIGLMIANRSLHVPGGSTITQQVARNFFLSPEVSISRKATEIFLSFRIENSLSKDEILELYLNKIFLGHRSYGVAAAAEFYYGKTLDQLSLAECAMLASLPKFPTTGNPLYNRERAIERRDWVLGRMLDNRFIGKAEYAQALQEPDRSYAHEPPIEVDAPYLAEMVRLEAIERLGNDALTDGYVVKTTLDGRLQDAAVAAVRDDLSDYDRRHGYRGPEAHVELPAHATPADDDRALANYRAVAGLIPGIVTEAGEDHGLVYLADGQSVPLDLDAMSWARAFVSDSRQGPKPKRVDAVLKPGDIVRLARDAEGKWQLAQVPQAQAALVALDPEDGAIKALVGGFNFQRSKFNRATMSARQPGSSFKPFLYSAAFEHGFTPASIVNDAPVVFPDPSQPNGVWAPSNDDDEFAGPMRLREALAQSKNLVSVRLLDAIGIRYAREYIGRFGFPQDALPDNLSMALGTASVSPLAMARGYAVFANGGFLVDPYFVAEIDDRDGKAVYAANPARACRSCPERVLADAGQAAPTQPAAAPRAGVAALAPIGAAQAAPAAAAGGPHLAPRVIDVRNDYLVTSLMQSVIDHGTGSGAKVLGRKDLAGKTGTTNDHRDAWFSGFNTHVVATVWVGLDDFGSLGRGEFGAKAALPIWIDFMRAALSGMPDSALPMPPGITTALIDRDSGLPAAPGDADAMPEIFRVEDLDRLRTRGPAQNAQQEQQHPYDIF
ncbi:MAG: penicillin-binding protein 1A [Mizugakiibacter sp.]|uniref:penicillin-binding protein 1A n=1 Tax=Mizugakiibacter sp. TaxID=1972610 RepID=UPI0031C5DB39|nr:penicillin-binding protein 1A [Xanthomonadaceae bacterium]